MSKDGRQDPSHKLGTGKGSLERFHRSNGFEPTGRLIDGEIDGRKYLILE